MIETSERGWLPDRLYYGGRWESDVAMFAGRDGRVTRFSREETDLRAASRLTGRALLPGMVNAHSHSFQRAIRGRTERRSGASRDTFWTWREAMYHAANELSPDDVYDVARMAFLEMAASGITAVGEFHYLHRDPSGADYDDPNLLARRVIEAAREVGIRIELQRTAYVRAGWRKKANPGQRRFLTPHWDQFIFYTEILHRDFHDEYAWVGVAPHSIRAVPLDYLRNVLTAARHYRWKIHMHVSEQPQDVQTCMGEYHARPVSLLRRDNILGEDFTAIHLIHTDGKEVAGVAASGAMICACPSTERNLGDGIGPAPDWFERKIGVCFGTDSNAQIDLLDEARQLEYHLRLQTMERAVLAPDDAVEGLAQRLFACATAGGAASIGAPSGELAPGKAADFFTVELNDLAIAGAEPDALLSNIVFAAGRAAIRDVYVGGRPVVQEGRHPLQDEIVERFRAVQRKLWGVHAMTPAEILLDLVALPSVSAQSNRAVIDYARARLDAAAWDVREFAHAPGKINLVAATRGDGDAGLALICHTDTVPYESDWAEAVRPVKREGAIYGRGSADVKGFLSCILAAAAPLDPSAFARPLTIVLTADEEIGCVGAKHLAAQHAFTARYAIVGEPTSLAPVRAGKGYVLAQIVVRGTEAHSAYPATGRSAIYDAARVIAALERVAHALASHVTADFDPPYTTLNIGLIEGGTAKNIVAGECRLTVEWRPVPGQDAGFTAGLIREELARLGSSHGVRAELRVLRADPPFAPSATSDLAEFLSSLTGRAPSTIAFGSEAAHLRALADEIVVFGPGSMSTAHRSGEHVPVSELDACADCLRAAIERYCATPSAARSSDRF